MDRIKELERKISSYTSIKPKEFKLAYAIDKSVVLFYQKNYRYDNLWVCQVEFDDNDNMKLKEKEYFVLDEYDNLVKIPAWNYEDRYKLEEV